MSNLSDHDLLLLVRGGNSPALIALYDRYASLVFSIAFRILRSRPSAEDVSQELFMRLWEDPHQIQMTNPTLHGWMTVASRNRAIDILRKKCPESLDTVSLPSPSTSGDEAEHRLMCEESLNSLGNVQRILLEMAYFENMTHAEIAFATGFPLGTIKTKIRRALKALRVASATRPAA